MGVHRRLARTSAKAQHKTGHRRVRLAALGYWHFAIFRGVGWALRLAKPTLALLAALPIALGSAHAVDPGEMLKDPALEGRARRISQELRCVVCQNQSIDGSNAPLAHDLRVIVRERLTAGDSDPQVLAFVEARYGEFVLLRPHLKPETLLLWGTPLLLLAAAAAYVFNARRHAAVGARPSLPLSPEEQRRLEELLREGADPSRPDSR
ncbi:MAG: cytochrome c-type biogenesis protein CcmH [Hyphomicrobiaceae bacterium]|nr:cytochrome c-type biogenesis protein CcmH [Hyphomicrobiaceae bacterium]